MKLIQKVKEDKLRKYQQFSVNLFKKLWWNFFKTICVFLKNQACMWFDVTNKYLNPRIKSTNDKLAKKCFLGVFRSDKLMNWNVWATKNNFDGTNINVSSQADKLDAIWISLNRSFNFHQKDHAD